MAKKVEIFSAGCPACESTIELVNEVACDNCEINILDMNDSSVSNFCFSIHNFSRCVPIICK